LQIFSQLELDRFWSIRVCNRDGFFDKKLWWGRCSN